MTKTLLLTQYRSIMAFVVLYYTAHAAVENGFAYIKSAPFLTPVFLLGLVLIIIELKLIRGRKGFFFNLYFSIYAIWGVISLIIVDIIGVSYAIEYGYADFMMNIFEFVLEIDNVGIVVYDITFSIYWAFSTLPLFYVILYIDAGYELPKFTNQDKGLFIAIVLYCGVLKKRFK